MGCRPTPGHCRGTGGPLSFNFKLDREMDDSFGVTDPRRSIIAMGQVSWFNPEKRFGFVKLENRLGDAFLHFDVLKAGGYYFVPRGTTVQVRVEPDGGKQRVIELVHVDTSTARPGEPPPLLRRPKP